jgi:hypothetical protein
MQAVYYRAPDGTEPVNDFVDALAIRCQVSLDSQINLLNLLTASDPPLAFPHSSQVRATCASCAAIAVGICIECSIGDRDTSSSCFTFSSRTPEPSRPKRSGSRKPVGTTSAREWRRDHERPREPLVATRHNANCVTLLDALTVLINFDKVAAW